MNEKIINKNIIEFIDYLNKLEKSDLRQLKELILSYSNRSPNELQDRNEFRRKDIRKGYLSLADKNKIEIIGGLPFLLNNTDYFPSSESIRKFSEDILHIKIPRGNKTRPELIGIIIVNIAELKSFETQRINNALNAVIKNVKSGSTKNIFLEWEKAIKSI
jgi:hypothetical protein